MTRYHFENYDDAAEYLSHARNRDKGRPLPGSGTRLKDMGTVYVAGTKMKAIGIFLYGTNVIRYLKTASGKQYISASNGGYQTQTTYTRLRNYLPHSFYVWRIQYTDVLVDMNRFNSGDWMKQPCYLLGHETLIDTKTNQIRYRKRREIDTINYFADTKFSYLRQSVEKRQKSLAELDTALTVDQIRLMEEISNIESLRKHLEKGDPIQGLLEIVEETREQAKLLQVVRQEKEALENELLFLKQKKTEHYSPEQERSVLNRV